MHGRIEYTWVFIWIEACVYIDTDSDNRKILVYMLISTMRFREFDPSFFRKSLPSEQSDRYGT